MQSLLQTPKHTDLIYDIGMHKGEDTDFYLRKGFRVVGFEANPELVGLCRERFKEFIEQKRLTIVAGAIVDRASIAPGQTKVEFYMSETNSVWGTVCPDWAERNQRMGDANTPIEVNVVDLIAVMEAYGVPHYMKIDIEGCDMACVTALRSFEKRPDYVSVETEKTSFGDIQQQIDVLIELGYDGFQSVEQSKIHSLQAPRLHQRKAAMWSINLKRDRQGYSAPSWASSGKRQTAFCGIIERYRSGIGYWEMMEL